MKLFWCILVLSFIHSAVAYNSYCRQMPNGQSVCNTFRDDGSIKSNYWSAPVNGQSYNTATFDDRSPQDE